MREALLGLDQSGSVSEKDDTVSLKVGGRSEDHLTCLEVYNGHSQQPADGDIVH